MFTYFSSFFPQYQCGFRKGYSAQHCLLAMTKRMKKARDNNKVCAAVPIDLSKAFDCLLHDLLIAKLHAFGFDLKVLRVIHAYLNDRIEVTKVDSVYSQILQIICGVPQGSILGPLLYIGNDQFVQKVTFEPFIDCKQNQYGSWKYYRRCYF